MRIIKAGIMDDIDVINQTKPGAELFSPERITWVAAVDGANQLETVSFRLAHAMAVFILTIIRCRSNDLVGIATWMRNQKGEGECA